MTTTTETVTQTVASDSQEARRAQYEAQTQRGKFQGESAWVPYFWEWSLDGEGESDCTCGAAEAGVHCDCPAVFTVDSEDRALFPELEEVQQVALYEREDGFVCGSIVALAPEPQDSYRSRLDALLADGVTVQTVRQWKQWGWTLDERIEQRARLNAYAHQGAGRPEHLAQDGKHAPGSLGQGFGAWWNSTVLHAAEALLRAQVGHWGCRHPGDVEIDAQILRMARPPVFGWVLTASGTHLLQPEWDSPETNMTHIAAFLRREHPEARCYWWDGAALWHIEAETLATRLQAHLPPPPPRVARLVVQEPRFLRQVLRFARGEGLLRQLIEQLRRLREWQHGACECILRPDWGWRRPDFSFELRKGGRTLISGGLIYHGPAQRWNGQLLDNACTVAPKDAGWSLHT